MRIREITHSAIAAQILALGSDSLQLPASCSWLPVSSEQILSHTIPFLAIYPFSKCKHMQTFLDHLCQFAAIMTCFYRDRLAPVQGRVTVVMKILRFKNGSSTRSVRTPSDAGPTTCLANRGQTVSRLIGLEIGFSIVQYDNNRPRSGKNTCLDPVWNAGLGRWIGCGRMSSNSTTPPWWRFLSSQLMITPDTTISIPCLTFVMRPRSGSTQHRHRSSRQLVDSAAPWMQRTAHLQNDLWDCRSRVGIVSTRGFPEYVPQNWPGSTEDVKQQLQLLNSCNLLKCMLYSLPNQLSREFYSSGGYKSTLP